MEPDLSMPPPCEGSAQYDVSTVLESTQFLTIHARAPSSSIPSQYRQRPNNICLGIVLPELND